MAEPAPLYAQPSQADAAIAEVAQGSAVSVTGERENGFLPVTLPDGTDGWMPETCVAQPVEGEWNGYDYGGGPVRVAVHAPGGRTVAPRGWTH